MKTGRKLPVRIQGFEGLRNDGYLYVLLANTNLSNAAFVMDRFKNLGYDSTVQDVEEIQL
jgi:hypothetical protein